MIALDVATGSEFEVRLPLATQVVKQQPVRVPTSPTSKLPILIIDDNVDAADALKLMLQLVRHETSGETHAQCGLRNLLADQRIQHWKCYSTWPRFRHTLLG